MNTKPNINPMKKTKQNQTKPNTKQINKNTKKKFFFSLKPSTFSDVPLLVRTSALLLRIMPTVSGQIWSLFNRYPNNLTKSVEADNSVGQDSSFSHWIFNCKAFEQDRNTFIKHNVDLNSKFTQINRTNSLGFSEDFDEDFENNIYYLMLNAFLDGCYAFDKLDIKRERRWWRGQLFKGSPESPVPYNLF
ncbi:hypothetical protein BCR32DRAFT_296376 [Anaeromyces robustus]|uniref:Uncharacterized protein n=1 Tax=Anaeromyces robustus TaxID=1754192 RepID=A0A1Y1WSV5_9FUNG|nr:hypothetical protein BCR32DRAFT_296376 [Anaeromyces robustus]|eukprot:ORX76214.1 hypothetical protein BCR32DRAFT_296376 [Anaeromyces robustus]